MKKNTPRITKVNEDVKVILKNELESFIKNYRAKNEIAPSIWIRDSKKFIDWISNFSPKHCIAFIGLCFSALKAIKDYPHKSEATSHIYRFEELIEIAEPNFLHKECRSIEIHSKSYGTSGLKLGYEAMERLIIVRLYNHFMNYPAALSALHVRMMDETKVSTTDKKTLEDLLRFVENTYKKKTSMQYIEPEVAKDIPFLLWQVIKANFPKGLFDSFLLAAEGDTKIRNIPNRTADRLITKTKGELKKIKREISYDSPITPGSEATFKDELEDKDSITPEEFLELSENQRIIAECLELLNNPSILTDRERQVLSMRYRYEEKQPTFEEVGKELGVSRPRAKQIEFNALEKVKSQFKLHNAS